MKRRNFTSSFKTKVVLEALSERYTLAELAERHQLHPNQISGWKSQFLANAETVFDKGAKSPKDQAAEEKDLLLKLIGEQKVYPYLLRNVAIERYGEPRITKPHADSFCLDEPASVWRTACCQPEINLSLPMGSITGEKVSAEFPINCSRVHKPAPIPAIHAAPRAVASTSVVLFTGICNISA